MGMACQAHMLPVLPLQREVWLPLQFKLLTADLLLCFPILCFLGYCSVFAEGCLENYSGEDDPCTLTRNFAAGELVLLDGPGVLPQAVQPVALLLQVLRLLQRPPPRAGGHLAGLGRDLRGVEVLSLPPCVPLLLGRHVLEHPHLLHPHVLWYVHHLLKSVEQSGNARAEISSSKEDGAPSFF